MIETIAFIIGAFLGGLIARFSFKKQSNIKFEILEVVIFYLLLFIFESRIRSYNLIVFGVIGFLSSIIAKGVSMRFSYLENIEIKRKKGHLIIGLENALRRRGFNSEEIKSIAKEIGFKDKEIRLIR